MVYKPGLYAHGCAITIWKFRAGFSGRTQTPEPSVRYDRGSFFLRIPG